MRLVFAGTPAFSVPALDALIEAGHQVVAVYTQPDRPAGRGRRVQPSPVAQRAAQLGLPTSRPDRLRGNDAALAELARLQPDCMVVVAYGLILPQAVLDIPRLGCLNIHASLLPRWRGAAPIQRAILAGDTHTGVTIMRMEAGLDTGPMLLGDRIAITPQTTAGELQAQLATLGAKLIVTALRGAQAGTLVEQVQPADGVTYAAKLDKAEARLDWNLDAITLRRCIHGYNPAPGAWCELHGERLKVLRAEAPAPAAQNGDVAPGQIVAADAGAWTVQCGQSLLRIIELQRPGGRPGAPPIILGGSSVVGRVLA